MIYSLVDGSIFCSIEYCYRLLSKVIIMEIRDQRMIGKLRNRREAGKSTRRVLQAKVLEFDDGEGGNGCVNFSNGGSLM